MFPPEIASIDEDSGQLTMQEQSLLSLQISSFFISIEAAVLLVLISRHFEIKTGGDSQSNSERDIENESFDELRARLHHGTKE